MATANRPMGPKGRGPMGPMKKPSKHVIKRLLKYILRYKFVLALVIICIALSAFAGARGSAFIKDLVDDHIVPLLAQENPDFSGLGATLFQMAVIYGIGIVGSYLYNRLMIIIAQGVLKTIRDDMFAHMQTLPIKYFDTHTHGDIMSHYTNDTDTLRQMIAQSLPQVFSSLCTIVMVFFMMITMNVIMTAFVVLFVAFMMLIAGKVGGKSAKYFVKQQSSLGSLNGYIEEMVNGQKVVKVFCHEETAIEDFDKLNGELFENASEANKYANILMPIMGNLANLQYILLAVFGGTIALLSGESLVTIGTIMSFLQLSKNFSMPISQVSQQINAVVMALAGAERIFTLMDEASETDEGYVTLVDAHIDENGNITEADCHTGKWAWKHPHSDGSVTYTKLCGDVCLTEVDFGYVEDKIVLHDISLFARPGQKVAFVGATGAGKTTITNLINRFYDIDDGKVRYDGININKIKKADLRRSLGVVLQDVNLFTGTVMENIRYGRLNATDEECIAAAKLANADTFINMLPEGYNTVLKGDGSGLSQGQRQLLSIARAAVADPPVMILDEATSSIDTRTEAIVQKGMDALMHGRTVFVIAHRLSTVRNSDVIMVLDHGRIIERGSHDELIAKKGNYYRLYTGAFELE